MSFKRFLMLLLALSLTLALAACNGGDNNKKCDGHVDADDNYLCDKCGEHYDDGDEAGDEVEVTEAEVNFVVKFSDGKILSGAKFTLTKGEKVYNLESGADGSVKQTVDIGTYGVYVDSETLPEYCWSDTFELAVTKDTKSLEIIIIDNTPNGSVENPFWLTQNETELTLAPGSELHFNYRGSTLKNITIEAEGLELNFDGNTYASVDGILSAQIAPASIGQIVSFTIKNTTGNTVNTVLKAYAPLGTEENPYVLTGNEATATVGEEQVAYYTYTAAKDGVLLILNKTDKGSITATRNVLKTVEGIDEPIIIPILAQTEEGNSIYLYVKAGDEIKVDVFAAGDHIEPQARSKGEMTNQGLKAWD